VATFGYGAGPMARDESTGRYRRTRLFVLTLGHSRKAVRLLVWRRTRAFGPNFKIALFVASVAHHG